MSQAKQRTILVIEADDSLRRLIALGLRHRGIHVIEASSPAHIPSIGMEEINLLILDINDGVHSDRSSLMEVQSHPDLSTLPTVVLAWECLSLEDGQHAAIATMMQTQAICLPKPFDARILYKAVEQLLAARAAQEEADVAEAEALLLASYARQTTPSIWPVMTAIGLLLAFIGMLLHIAVTVLGLLIVVVALLLWTLGKKPEQGALAVG